MLAIDVYPLSHKFELSAKSTSNSSNYYCETKKILCDSSDLICKNGGEITGPRTDNDCSYHCTEFY